MESVRGFVAMVFWSKPNNVMMGTNRLAMAVLLFAKKKLVTNVQKSLQYVLQNVETDMLEEQNNVMILILKMGMGVRASVKLSLGGSVVRVLLQIAQMVHK